MSVWVDPNLLSMLGVGVIDDPDMPDGRHLRWFPGRYVGFPRSGFQLSRHPSLVNADWDAPSPNPLIRQQPTSQADVGLGVRLRVPSGLTIGKAAGFSYQTVGSGSPAMRIDSQPVTLDFGAEGPGPTFPAGPGLSNPAAFVRLTVLRRRNTGHVSATAYYNAHPELRYQDSGFVGPPLVGWLPPHLNESVVETPTGWRVPSSAERLMGSEALAKGERRRPPRFPPLDPNPWVTQTVLLHGPFLEHVEITGSNAALGRVQWVTVRQYAGDLQWEVVDTIHLPLTDDPSIYPQWSALPGEEVALHRLQLAPPNRNLPWDDPAFAVESNLKLRYLGEAFADVDDAMRLFLKGELAEHVPQAEVEVEQELEEDPPSAEPETMVATVRPFEHLYVAATDPQVARMVGLMTTDFDDPSGVYDYRVMCRTPQAWVQWSLNRAEARRPAGRPVAAAASRNDILIALATGVVRRKSPPPPQPNDIRADVMPDLNAMPMPARVELSWTAAAASVFFELRRDGELLHHRDDDSGLVVPHLPTQRLPRDGRLRLVDRSIPAWDTFTWSLRSMDFWGRFSPEATVTAKVQDVLAPPAPTSLDARLSGPASAAPGWDGVTVSFDWTGQHELIAPDLDRFEIHLVQRAVDRADEGDPSTWGRFEHLPAAALPPLVVRWPGMALEGLPPGVTGSVVATPIPLEDGGGQRLAVEVGPAMVPFTPGEAVALVSATVRATDVFGNAGPFAAHGVARRFDETPPVVPVMPGDVRLASRPDAFGRAGLKIEWPDLAASQVRVMRGSGSALLAAAAVDMDAYALMDRAGRAQTLRGAALLHREVFVADHEMPYGAGPCSHVAHLNAGETGLTVFTIQATSATGIAAPWPSSGGAFVVAAVPSTRPPVTPLVTEARAGDRQVTIRIAPDPSGEADVVRLYRSRDAGSLDDVRTMRLVGEVPAPPAGGQDLQIEDDDVYDEVDYWYRAIAVGATGASAPSAPVLVRPFTTEPPQPPVIVEAKRLPTGRVVVKTQIARRDLPLFLYRRPTGTVGWTPATGTGIGPDGRLDLTALPARPVAEGYELNVQDQAPGGIVFRYLLRVRDSQGRQAESNQMEEAS